MNARHYLDCTPSLTHGNIIQRVIFTKQDPENPEARGAVMKHIDSFARGYLEAGVSSAPHVNEGIQEVFFVAGGSGTLIMDGQQRVCQGRCEHLRRTAQGMVTEVSKN